MAISILNELDLLASQDVVGQFNSGFFLTYTLNLRFFEQLVLPRLQRIGVNHVAVLCDVSAYSASFGDPFPPEECGKSYIVGTSSAVTTRQHAKMLWLHGDYDRVFVGSHNLTMSGFNDQLEVTTVLDSSELSHNSALQGLHRAVTHLVEGSRHLQLVWSRISIPTGESDSPSRYFYSNLEHGLLQQVSGAVGDVDHIGVVTPYLDAGALLKLKQEMSATEITLDLPNEGPDTPLSEAVDRIPNLVARRVPSNLRLHGKAYSFTGNDERWLAIGSANCTNAGLINSASEGGNVEFLILIPNASLPEIAGGLEVIEDPSTEQGTGRNWDEAEISSQMVKIDSAEYRNDVLTVSWSETGRPLDSATLVCLGERYPCDGSPIEIRPDEPPTEVLIEVTSKGVDGTARAWVVQPESLQEYAANASSRRWRDYISSDNPIDHANGIDAIFRQLMRDTLIVSAESENTFASTKRVEARHLKKAIEGVGFSPDLDEVEFASRILVSGNSDVDLLGALRGLILRVGGSVVPNSMSDERSVATYERRRQRAARSGINRLIKHLALLSGSNMDWSSSQPDQLSVCLTITFEATALIWHDLVLRNSETGSQGRLLERFLKFLDACNKRPETKLACRESGVGGPIVLAVGAALAGADDSDRSRLHESTMALVVNPRQIFDSWKKDHEDRMEMLNTEVGSEDRLQGWARPVFRLFGELDPHVIGRQMSRWGPLLDIHALDEARELVPDELLEHAELIYKSDPIWEKYKVTKNITFAAGTSCICGMLYSLSKRHRIENGDPVICDLCGRLVMWRTS